MSERADPIHIVRVEMREMGASAGRHSPAHTRRGYGAGLAGFLDDIFRAAPQESGDFLFEVVEPGTSVRLVYVTRAHCDNIHAVNTLEAFRI